MLINRNLPAQSEVVDRLGESEKARLEEFFHVRQQLGDAVWPGWGSADIPVIAYNEARAFLVGYSNPPPGWVKVPQGEARGSDGYISLLSHESFHAYQGQVAAAQLAAAETIIAAAEPAYPWDDASFHEAWQRELDILAEAAEAETEADARDLAQQFLAQRAERRRQAGLAPQLIAYEGRRSGWKEWRATSS